MSNNDFSMMGRPRVDAPPPRTSNTALYLMFAGGVVLAALVGALVAYFILRQPAQNVAARNAPGGQQAAGNVAGPQWTTTDTFGSWLVRCQNKNGTTGKPCLALLQVVNQQNKRTMFAWIVGLDAKGAVQAVMQTPTGINVGKGIDIKFGTETPRHVDFSNCLPQQCSATTTLDEAFVKDMTTQPKADVVIVASNGQSLDFGIPVAGFDKALAAIKK
jgi:invasion protein IalB